MKKINYLFKVYSLISLTHRVHTCESISSAKTDDNTAMLPKGRPLPFVIPPSSRPILSQPLMGFLSLEISSHFLEFYVNGITEYVRFFWLLSPSVFGGSHAVAGAH